jgi:diacylglycerol kinase
VAAVSVAGFLRLPPLAWAVLVLVIAFVLVAELLNTAVEAVVDLVSPERHELAKRAKDVAAAAVLIASIGAAVAAFCLFMIVRMR